jgi:hypothetical protein
MALFEKLHIERAATGIDGIPAAGACRHPAGRLEEEFTYGSDDPTALPDAQRGS